VQYCIGNRGGGGVSIDSHRAKLEHLRLEEWAARSDLLPAGVIARR
jgi:hypothetical protein